MTNTTARPTLYYVKMFYPCAMFPATLKKWDTSGLHGVTKIYRTLKGAKCAGRREVNRGRAIGSNFTADVLAFESNVCDSERVVARLTWSAGPWENLE